MKAILFASSNLGKLVEVKEVFQNTHIKIVSLLDIEQELKSSGEFSKPPEVEESGSTYLENARIKACAYFSWSKIPSLADDAGLEVNALSAQPGIHSARYAGIEKDAKKNIEKLLGELKGINDRSARFYCELYLKIDEKKSFSASGEVRGKISESSIGSGGFGYDSVFIPNGYDKTLAELKEQEILIETHRVNALKKLVELIF